MRRKAGLVALLWLSCSSPAYAHSAERGFVMLLPTTLIMLAGSLAVAISCAVSLTRPDRITRGLSNWTCPVMTVRLPPAGLTQLLAAVVLAGVIAIGFLGPTDPLKNLLPLSVWTVWWVVVVLLHPVIGNLWAHINPLGLVERLGGLVAFSPRAAYWPSLALFLAFAWFQLIHPKAEDPRTLATVLTVYVALTIAAAVLFGGKAWLAGGDPFVPIFRFLSLLAPMKRNKGGMVHLCFPGSRMLQVTSPPLAASLLILATLSTITFDAIASSFAWLSLIGVNPLDFPGRTAVMWPNSLGLVASFLVLTGMVSLATAAGWAGAGRPTGFLTLFGWFSLSFLPISIAFHFAHYLTVLLVNGQYAWAALVQPFGAGESHVTTSFLNTAQGAWTIFSLQAAAIVLGHMMSVLVAHMVVCESGLTGRRALALEWPMAVLMVAFTGFSLWALSAPSIG